MSPGRPGARAARGSPPRGVRSGNRRFVARNLQGRGRGWRLWVGAWLAVVGGCMGGIATIGLRHAGDTPWWGVYGSKTPCWCGLVAVFGRGWACCGRVAGPAVGAWLGLLWVRGWRLWVGAWGELRP